MKPELKMQFGRDGLSRSVQSKHVALQESFACPPHVRSCLIQGWSSRSGYAGNPPAKEKGTGVFGEPSA